MLFRKKNTPCGRVVCLQGAFTILIFFVAKVLSWHFSASLSEHVLKMLQNEDIMLVNFADLVYN